MNLYYLDVSPPCRSVLILARILGLDLNLKSIDLQNHAQLKKDFLSINPCHTVPTLEVRTHFLLQPSQIIIID